VFSSRKLFLFVALAYLVFIVYGSLVPLVFHPRPLDVALRDFLHIRYLQLGMDSRADWVANILLYIPLPYFWLGFASRRDRVFRLVLLSFLAFVFSVVLSVAIEFTQQFFPPRTVSLNDIFAEIFGTVIGIFLWWASGEKVRDLIESLLAEGNRAAYAGLVLYTMGYLAFSLFPYDFLISAAEISAKLSGNYFHWFASQSTCGNALRCGSKLIAESAAVVPVGLLIGLVSRRSGGSLVRSAGWIGFGLGLIIETLQFFLVSGLSLGASVVTRIVGVMIGAAAGENLKRRSLWPFLYLVRPFVPLASAAYVFLLLSTTWFGKGPSLGLEDGMKRLQEIHFMPFYYHYYTSESAAMTSLFAVAIMFVPMGILYWVWRITMMREFVLRGAVNAAFVGAVIAMGIELGKLFLRAARPDPTNILIAALAMSVGFIAASLCTRSTLNLSLMESESSTEAASQK